MIVALELIKFIHQISHKFIDFTQMDSNIELINDNNNNSPFNVSDYVINCYLEKELKSSEAYIN